MGVQVIWFKRDLRIADHAPLVNAIESGLTIPLYIFEPELWEQPDMSLRHYEFLLECLQELDNALRHLGQPLVFRTGEACEVLREIHSNFCIDALWSHQETWNGWTYKRDLSVKAWCRRQCIPWHEPLQFGVKRVMASRKGWAERWNLIMDRSIIATPHTMEPVQIESDPIPSPDSLNIASDRCTDRLPGGRSHGLEYLNSFLFKRGKNYQKEMSSPGTAFDACSRISPYLAFGVISMREAYQAATERKKHLIGSKIPEKHLWIKSTQAFISRLYWHCHFIQKLEDEPEIEFRSIHQDMLNIRGADHNEAYLEAWVKGRTGFPLVDGCMRALQATGWLNFRMRAMVMSFATYHLWLPWREPALHLARLFLDYEPGIHYSQCQMQAGVTGINSIRIYNPIKQGLDLDPDARFIKKWVPELRKVSPVRIHEVYSIHHFCADYPPPIVDEKKARKQAADTIFAIRSRPGFKEKSYEILQKLGSRKAGLFRSKVISKPRSHVSNNEPNSHQLELPL